MEVKETTTVASKFKTKILWYNLRRNSDIKLVLLEQVDQVAMPFLLKVVYKWPTPGNETKL